MASSVAVRQNVCTGVTQRRHSSTAPGSSDASAARAARWSWCSDRAIALPDTSVRVVLVARHQQREEEHEQLLLAERLPSTSLPTRSETRSCPGRSRLARMCSTMKLDNSPSTAIVSSGGRSGDSIAASDHRRKSSRSASSIPRSSAITVMGNGADSSATKSISARASTASSSPEALLRIDSRAPTARRGENWRFTDLRKTACSGGSMCRIERPSIGVPVARIGSLTRAPWPEQKCAGSRLRSRMSS